MKALLLRVRSIYRKVPSALRTGWVTAWVTFTGTMLALLTSLLPDLSTAITTRNFNPFLDSLAFTTQAAFSAVLALGAGVVNAVYRWLRPVEAAYVTDAAIGNAIDDLQRMSPSGSASNGP